MRALAPGRCTLAGSARAPRAPAAVGLRVVSEKAAEGLAVVSKICILPSALEAREANAIAAGDFEVRGERRLGRLARLIAGGNALRQAIGESAERI